MKDISTEEFVDIPENIDVSINARQVIVKGPRGVLKRDFRHITMEIRKVGCDKIGLRVWHGKKKHNACLRTIASHIKNLFTGVTSVRLSSN